MHKVGESLQESPRATRHIPHAHQRHHHVGVTSLPHGLTRRPLRKGCLHGPRRGREGRSLDTEGVGWDVSLDGAMEQKSTSEGVAALAESLQVHRYGERPVGVALRVISDRALRRGDCTMCGRVPDLYVKRRPCRLMQVVERDLAKDLLPLDKRVAWRWIGEVHVRMDVVPVLATHKNPAAQKEKKQNRASLAELVFQHSPSIQHIDIDSKASMVMRRARQCHHVRVAQRAVSNPSASSHLIKRTGHQPSLSFKFNLQLIITIGMQCLVTALA